MLRGRVPPLVDGSQMPFWLAVASIYRMALVVSRTQAPCVMCALPHTNVDTLDWPCPKRASEAAISVLLAARWLR